MHEDFQLQMCHITVVLKSLYRHLLFPEMEDGYLLIVRSISL